jgi:hypothetical protein
MENKVVVLTKTRPFGTEEYIDVFSSIKALEKHLRENVSKYLKKDGEGQYHVEDVTGVTLYFGHKVIVKG